MSTDEIPLMGTHNVANVMAALLVGLAAGLEREALREAVVAFRALPHRLERIAEQDGVVFVDDSKATNPGAVVAALEAVRGPVILIAGGKSKRTDFRAMAEAATRRARAVILIGEAADELEPLLTGVPTVRAASMSEAVELARERATAGDAVLLSPGCASFDMFESAEDRGEAFAGAVRGPLVGAGGRARG